MKIEKQNKLYDKYPELFAQKDWTMDKTCMRWGIECGDGWYNIVEDACERIILHCKKENLPYPQFVLVKEKWGSLRIYLSHYPDAEIDHIVREAETRSEKTCELCGSPSEIDFSRGWVSSACDDCKKKG